MLFRSFYQQDFLFYYLIITDFLFTQDQCKSLCLSVSLQGPSLPLLLCVPPQVTAINAGRGLWRCDRCFCSSFGPDAALFPESFDFSELLLQAQLPLPQILFQFQTFIPFILLHFLQIHFIKCLFCSVPFFFFFVPAPTSGQ